MRRLLLSAGRVHLLQFLLKEIELPAKCIPDKDVFVCWWFWKLARKVSTGLFWQFGEITCWVLCLVPGSNTVLLKVTGRCCFLQLLLSLSGSTSQVLHRVPVRAPSDGGGDRGDGAGRHRAGHRLHAVPAVQLLHHRWEPAAPAPSLSPRLPSQLQLCCV